MKKSSKKSENWTLTINQEADMSLYYRVLYTLYRNRLKALRMESSNILKIMKGIRAERKKSKYEKTVMDWTSGADKYISLNDEKVWSKKDMGIKKK